jgi:cell fate regulator YaaT (PSP1 superfamily)
MKLIDVEYTFDNNKVIFADGYLSVDGIVIYELRNFSCRMWNRIK